MSVIFMNPLHPEDAGELWPQLLKDRKQLKKRKAEKNAAVISGTICFTLELLCAFFGYVYLFFEDRLFEYFEKLPVVKRFFDLMCDHILSRGEIKWYFSLALTVGLLFALPVAVSLVFKLFTALVYHPKAAEPCPEGSDEQIAGKLFRFADDSFELNAKLNDRGKAPKIVSMAATAIMAGLSIYGFIFVTGAQIKVSIPLLAVGLILLVVSLFFAVYGLETLISLLIKIFYYRSNKNIYDFRTAAEEMYNALCPPDENQADLSEQSGHAEDTDMIGSTAAAGDNGTADTVQSDEDAAEGNTLSDEIDITYAANITDKDDVTDAVNVSDAFAQNDAADSAEVSFVSADNLPLEGFSVVSDQVEKSVDSFDGTSSSDGVSALDDTPVSDNAPVSDNPPVFDDAPISFDDADMSTSPADASADASDAGAASANTTTTDTTDSVTATDAGSDTNAAAADTANAGAAITDTAVKGAVYAAAAGAAAVTGAAASRPDIFKKIDQGKEGSLSKAELKKYSPSLWSPLYVAENEQQCVSVVSEYNKAAIDSLKQHSFNDGQEGLKNAAKCLLKMAEYDAEKYEPQLYITLYAIGKVSAFGQNDREQARASLAACRRIAEKCARPERKGAPRAEKELTVIRRIISDFESDMTMDELREKYGKNFPADLCGNN